MAKKAEVPGTRAGLKQARERDRQLDELRREKGEGWVRENEGRLRAEWEYAKDLGLV